MLDAFSRRDWKTWLSMMSDDVSWFPLSSLLDGQGYEGRDAVADWLGRFVIARGYSVFYDESEAEVDGDRLLLPVIPSISGDDIDRSGLPKIAYLVFTFRDGMVCASHAHADEPSARRELQTGVWSPPQNPNLP